MSSKSMLDKSDWEEFRKSGMLWWVNRILHLFGWAIAVEVDDSGNAVNGYPARCKFRGFSEVSESEGFEKVTKYLSNNIGELLTDLDA